MRSVRISAVLTMALMVSVMAAPLPVVAADTEPADVPDGMGWDPARGLIEDTLAVDARRISRRLDKPYSQVLAQLRAQERLDDLLFALETDDPDFAGAYWTGDGELVVQFKDEPAQSLLELLGKTSGIRVIAKQVRYSTRDLERMHQAVLGGLRAAGVSLDDLVVGIDPKRQRIVATVRVSGAGMKESVLNEVSQRVPDDVLSISFTDGPVFDDLVGPGGM